MGNILLLIFSIIIYASFGLKNIIYIIFSSLSSFFVAKYEGKYKKALHCIFLILNIMILVVFKSLSFINNNIIVPLGISYYTFQILSYMIDTYKGKYKPETKIIDYLLYVLYIPYLFIGPINRYDEIKIFIKNKKNISKDNFLNGMLRLSLGLFKKYIIAQRIGIIVGTISLKTTEYYGAYVLFATLIYSFQLYADFSGGIDIIIGFSNILGIKLKENFDTPYLSLSIKEFWRRWHISLSSWFKDYVYIPLGGNKCSEINNKINIIITFIVSGLWHGFNYLLWGLLHGILVVFSPQKTKCKYLNILTTFIIVSLLWIFFIYPDTLTSIKMLGTIFYKFNYVSLINNISELGLNKLNLIITLFSLILLIINDIYNERIKNYIYSRTSYTKYIIILTTILLVLVFGIYGLDFEKSNFIYSKF